MTMMRSSRNVDSKPRSRMAMPSLSLLSRSSMALLLTLLVWFGLIIACFGSTTNEEESANDNAELERILSSTFPPTCKIDCSCPRFSTTEEDGARLAYLITVHNRRTAEDAAYLFRAIRSPRNVVMVHVDTKYDWDEFANTTLYYEMEACPCGTKIHVETRFDSKWSSWSMNDPTFWGMAMALQKYRNQWDVFINLSGDTMPVYTQKVMAQFFDPKEGPLRGINFVTSSSCETGLVPSNVYIFPEFWHKRSHYTTHPDGNPVIKYVDEHGKEQEMELIIHFGSQWMALQPDFCEYLVTELKRPDSLASRFKENLIETRKLMTDETFIPTLLMHVSPFNETLPDITQEGQLKSLPSMTSIRYERMDEHSPSAFGYFPTQQRYDVPESSDAGKPRVWGPYFLGVYDLANIKQSGALFVRKVSVAVDPNIVYMLPVDDIDELPSIQWPNEVQIIKKPDWEGLRDHLMRQAKEKEEKKKRKHHDKQDGDTHAEK